MNTKKIFFSFLFSLISLVSVAEEGMLIPSVVSAFESDMKAMGMHLSAQDIYDVNHSSIKDAIIHFGGGCTAEIVSDKGLILTNHHCGFSYIQSHSSLEKDYLKNGFWAKNFEEELPNPGLEAARVVRIEDVTKSVLFGLESIQDEKEKVAALKKNIQTLIQDAQKNNHYSAKIKPFNYGNEYYMIVKESFEDVRLVGTPPNAIGKFGGDTDNWVWPRHTGDFSVFRIYANNDNKPAPYSKENQPYKPLHVLPVSIKDRKVGDFTMVYGFPGTTEQHLSAAQLKYIVDVERPAVIAMREKSLSVIDAAMRASDEVRIKYSAKQARIANAYKKWIGQIGGLKELNAIGKKLDFETEYQKRAASKTEWNEKYGAVLALMNQLVLDKSKADFAYNMAIEYLYVGPELFDIAGALYGLETKFQELLDSNQLDAKIAELKEGAGHFFKNYDEKVDRSIFELLTIEYYDRLGINLGKDIRTFTSEIYTSSATSNKERYFEILDEIKKKKKIKVLKKDVGYQHWKNVRTQFINDYLGEARAFRNQMDAYLKTYVAGKREMFPEMKQWPDANSTLRITYGKLEGSSPKDGMKYIEHTNTDGILQKHISGNPDFELLPELVDLYKKKDFGQYAQGDEMWVCFTGSNHTTGGNSGSPVLDADGNLIGLNFDRSWESTMSDFMFDASRCRNIVVDARYVLWVIDKYAGAKYLVDEMTLVK